MAGSSRGVLGGFAVLAIVLMGLGCPRQAERGEKGWMAQGASRPGPNAQLTVDLGGRVTMELILIPPGTFLMGSDKGRPEEKPVHRVTVKKAFFMGKYEVTQEQWQAVMGSNPSPSPWKGHKRPAEMVDWNACREFVAILSARTGGKFCLPSEAEWEYACRAGSTTEFCYGEDEAGIDRYAWCNGSSRELNHPVGQKKPNQFGLFDMHGNVWEWCEDLWHESYDGAPTDGSAWSIGDDLAVLRDYRVLRGGSWLSRPTDCRSGRRLLQAPSTRNVDIGFRVVLRDF